MNTKTYTQSNKIKELLLKVENIYTALFQGVNINIIGMFQNQFNCNMFDFFYGRINFISCYNQLNYDDDEPEGIIEASNLYVNCIIKFVTMDSTYKEDIIIPKNIKFKWDTLKPVGGGIINCKMQNKKTNKLIHLKRVIRPVSIYTQQVNSNVRNFEILHKTYYTTELIIYK